MGDWIRIETAAGVYMRKVTAVAGADITYDAVPEVPLPGNTIVRKGDSIGTVTANANLAATAVVVTLTTAIKDGDLLYFSGGATGVSGAAAATGNAVNVTIEAPGATRAIAVGETVTPGVQASRGVSSATAVYRFSSNATVSLAILHVLEEWQRAVTGVGINSFALAFDANEEPKWTASGPARNYFYRGRNRVTGVISGDGGATDVFVPGYDNVTAPLGDFEPPNLDINPPSGLQGRLFVGEQAKVGSTEVLFKKMDFTVENAMMLRNTEYGVSVSSELYRSGRRAVSGTLEAYLDGARTEWFNRSVTDINGADLSVVQSNASVLIQTGTVRGNMIGVFMPRMEVTNPQQDDPEEAVTWTFNIMALESERDANDEMELVFA